MTTKERHRDAVSLAVKVEEGAMNHEMWAASRRRAGQENRSSPSASRKEHSLV